MLHLDAKKIAFVSEFCYLGVVFQASGISFIRHAEKRARGALWQQIVVELNQRYLSICNLFKNKVSFGRDYRVQKNSAS